MTTEDENLEPMMQVKTFMISIGLVFLFNARKTQIVMGLLRKLKEKPYILKIVGSLDYVKYGA